MSTHHQTIIASLLNQESQPFVININGYCMQPILECGDKVSVLPSRYYFPGDIVIFQHPLHGFTAHRMLGVTFSKKGVRYMTKADSAKVVDRLLEVHKVLGRINVNISQNTSIRPSLNVRLLCMAQLVRNTIMIALKKLN